MHDGMIEDGRQAVCWGCGVNHYTDAPNGRSPQFPSEDLCEDCGATYDLGVEKGRYAVRVHRSDFERRSMPQGPMRIGYMRGRFLEAAAQSRRRKTC